VRETTTLAAMLNEINESHAVHVVTLGPIEFVHRHKNSPFRNGNWGPTLDDYPSGLRAALRRREVILVGEMRDRETVEIALTAAETGPPCTEHHPHDRRRADDQPHHWLFEQSEEKQLRLRLADTLRYVVSQRLGAQGGGGRLLLSEVMGTNLGCGRQSPMGRMRTGIFTRSSRRARRLGGTHLTVDPRGYDADLLTRKRRIFTRRGRGR